MTNMQYIDNRCSILFIMSYVQGSKRQPGEGRTAFHASMRNEAMRPLTDPQAASEAAARLRVCVCVCDCVCVCVCVLCLMHKTALP